MVAKNAERTLVIAPKGTVKDEHGIETNHDPAQWIKEFNFALTSQCIHCSVVMTLLTCG